MAEIAPFKGVLYNQELIPDMSAVITPPYDVISPEEREIYHKRHPYNMIRLILGRAGIGDTEDNNRYTRAAETLRSWQREKILIRDPRLAIYDYEMDYLESTGLVRTRQGFICLVHLQDFTQGSVRPHEQTYEETKSDRLKLMCACNANLSQIFALYGDRMCAVSATLKRGREGKPVFAFKDKAGIHHRMWRVTNRDVIEKVAAEMKDKPLFIADGHHRYETALNYQKLMREKYPKLGDRASFNYILMYLSNMNQEGFSILPTHRMLVQVPGMQMDSFLVRAADYFEVTSFPFDSTGRPEALEAFLTSLHSAGDRNAIGVYETTLEQFTLLKLREDVPHEVWRCHLPFPLQKLDVVLLNDLILKQMLKVDDRILHSETGVQYSHDAREAIEQVDCGVFRIVFLLNPTRIEEVQQVANAGLIMPHKSTYFYPKVINGSVLNLLNPEEDVLV